MHLILFLLLLSLNFSKQSMFLCFWKDSRWVCSLNYLVILSNYYVFLFIVRKCECSCVFYSFSNFHCVFKKRLLFICFVTVFWFLKDFQLKSLDFWSFQKLIFKWWTTLWFRALLKKTLDFLCFSHHLWFLKDFQEISHFFVERGPIYLVIMKI